MRKLFKTDVDEFTPFSFTPIDFHLKFFQPHPLALWRLLSQFKSLSDQHELNNEDGEKEIEVSLEIYFFSYPFLGRLLLK